jgi:hypothetical protein
MSKNPLRDLLNILRQQEEALAKAIAELEQHSFITTTNSYIATNARRMKMSAKVRAKIAAAQRKRWAKWKKANKRTAPNK